MKKYFNNSIAFIGGLSIALLAVRTGKADNMEIVEEQLRAMDYVVSQGSVAYERKRGEHYIKEEITYLRDHRFLARTTNYKGHISKQRSELPIGRMFDGRDNYTIVHGPGQPYTNISAGEPVDVSEEFLVSGSLYPGASFILGRGLTALKGFKTGPTVNGENAYETKLLDGSVIKAVLDSGHGHVAKKIIRYKNGQVVQQVILGAPKLVNGCWIASSAVCQNPGSESDQYKLLTARFFKPPETLFIFRAKKGDYVVDERMGQPIGWVVETPKTSQQLFEKTREKAMLLLKMQTKQQQQDRLQSYMRFVLLMTPLLFLGIVSYVKLKFSVGN